MLKIYNTLSRTVEEFKPLNSPLVTLYTCGPTVYDYTHIGHLFKYVNDDILKKTLRANGFRIKHVMNITDVGHLTSDEDTGEDKLEKGAKETGRTVWEVAKYFEDYFFSAIGKVNIERAEIISRATEHISEQVKLIEKLEKNGFTYITEQAVYFDVSKFKGYTKLSRQSLEGKEVGVRKDVYVDPQKKHPADFALWFFTVGHFANHTMRWDSPWGNGFPGWHIECSAMAMCYLGDTLDIHTGGIDHIPVHHTNEIAQSEAVTGKQFVKYWVHHEFLNIDKEKMSKSLKNFIRLEDLEEKGYDPLSLRYLFLTAHHRSELSFSYGSLDSAQNALNNLRSAVRDWENPTEVLDEYYEKFLAALNNDIGTPQALAVVWELVKSDKPTSKKGATLLKMDEVLSLGLEKYVSNPIKIPENIKKMLSQREEARKSGDFETSDKLRNEIKRLGFEVEDTTRGYKVKKLD